MQLFFILGHFLPFYPPNSLKNKNLKKTKKNPWDIIILHMCARNYDHMMYGSWDMVPDRCNCYFSFWAIFALLLPLKPKKSKFSKNKKKIPEDMIILHMCAKNYDQMMYGSWDMLHDRRTDKQTNGQKKWHVEVGAPPKKKQTKNKTKQNKERAVL